MTIEKYVNIHKNIKLLLHHSYIDLFYLQILSSFENKDPAISISKYALVHLCELLKVDLCLNISKMCFDGDSRAASIINLQICLNNIYIEQGKEGNKRTFAGKTIEQKNKIRTMRDKYIAHCDFTRTMDDICIVDLESIFEDARSFFNELCDPSIDASATPFSSIEMMGLAIQSQGFDKLIHEGAF